MELILIAGMAVGGFWGAQTCVRQLRYRATCTLRLRNAIS